MFKQAYVRGVQNALIQAGHATYPDIDVATKIADYIADNLDFSVLTEEGEPVKVAGDVLVKVAEHLLEASDELREGGYKQASFEKISSVEELSEVAGHHAIHLMKIAEGSTIEGGDKGNDEPSSAEAKMDLSDRPDGYAEDSQGDTDVDTRPGAVGKEDPQPNAPSESPGGTNSVVEQTRTASLSSLLKKIAEGSTIEGGDKGNQEETTAEGKMDKKNRPDGYAVLPGQGDGGELHNMVGDKAVVGTETPHPNAPGEHPDGTNSVIQHSQKAANDKLLAAFRKTASEVLPYLHGSLSEQAKIAHIQALIPLSNKERAHYIHDLNSKVATQTKVAMPDYSRFANMEAKEQKPGAEYDLRAKKADKNSESDDAEKNASTNLMSSLRAILKAAS